MFPNIIRNGDYSATVCMVMPTEFQMGRFAAPLGRVQFEPGETYAYRVSVTIVPGETFAVYEGNFIQGNAE